MLRYKISDVLYWYWDDINIEVQVVKCFDKHHSYSCKILGNGEIRTIPEYDLFPTKEIFKGAYFRVGEIAYYTNVGRKAFQKVKITDIFKEGETIYYKCLFDNNSEITTTISHLSFEPKSIWNRS